MFKSGIHRGIKCYITFMVVFISPRSLKITTQTSISFSLISFISCWKLSTSVQVISSLGSLDYQDFLFLHYSLYPIEYRKFVMVVSILYMYIYFISRAYKNRVEHCISSVSPLCIFPLYINFMTNILGCYTKELDDFLLIG